MRACPKCGKHYLTIEGRGRVWVCLGVKCGYSEPVAREAVPIQLLPKRCPKCELADLLVDSTGELLVCGNSWCSHFEKISKPSLATEPSIVIEIRGGALVNAYADRDVELVLVDWDEIEHGSSAVVIPDAMSAMSAETRLLAEDAKRRLV